MVSVKSLLNLVWWLVFVDLLEAVSTSCSVELVLSADVFGPRRLILRSFVWMKVINEIHFVGNLSAVWSILWFLSCVKEEETFLSVFLSLQMTFCVQCNLDQVSSCKFVAQNLHLTKYDFYQLSLVETRKTFSHDKWNQKFKSVQKTTFPNYGSILLTYLVWFC